MAKFSLNAGDNEVGMTFLHHLFSNFDLNAEKASSLFRKMNSLHLRPSAGQQGMFGSVGTVFDHTPLSIARSNATGIGGRVSPIVQRSKMRSDFKLLN